MSEPDRDTDDTLCLDFTSAIQFMADLSKALKRISERPALKRQLPELSRFLAENAIFEVEAIREFLSSVVDDSCPDCLSEITVESTSFVTHSDGCPALMMRENDT